MNTPFIVNPGVYGVKILLNGVGLHYTDGDGTNQSYSNADLQIDLGSVTTPSGRLWNPRVFNGGVTYTPTTGLFALFSATPTVGVSPLAVTFTDSSLSSDPLGVATWAWDFDNDGIVDSNAQNPSSTYMGGTFSVALTVTDASNPSATTTKIDYIVADPVQAVFTAANTSGPSPLAVTFTDASTGAITLYEWDFDNDGVIDSNVQSPSHTYMATGKYSVALTVSNASNSSTQTEIGLVIVDGLTPSFTASANAVSSGSNVAFTDTSTGNPTAWAWDLDGDGMVDSNVQNPNFTYTAPGIVTVTLTASNAAHSEVATNTIEVDTIPMLAFSRTFSSSSQTRGYWFVTPVGFSITGLQVPDEQATGLQNVAVAKTT
ncbi:MAG: PKD domain-containing protein, partial [bacterium]|nr:PKD domain-containing protein [bacterium]